MGSSRDEFFCGLTHHLKVTAAPTNIKLRVAAIHPSKLFEPMDECFGPRLSLWIIFGEAHQHTDEPRPFGLLRAPCKRPRRCAAEQRDELTPF